MLNITDLATELNVNGLPGLPAAAVAVLGFAPEEPVFIFEGEMGAGKTTLIKEMCRQLGVQDNVSSPTFSLINEYETRNGVPVYHFDFYRIDRLQEAIDAGCLDYFDSGNYCFIEWPSRVAELLPEHYVRVDIQSKAGEERTITLTRI